MFTLMGIETLLKGGLYRNTCLKLNLFVKNAIKNLKDGLVKIEDFVLMNANTNSIKDFLQGNGKIQYFLNVFFAERNLGSKTTDSNRVEENIVHRNAIGKTNQREWLERKTLNTLMEEPKNMQRHFIFQQNGENYGRKSIRETIGLAKTKNAKGRVGDCMPIISCQWEYARIHSTSQTLVPYVQTITINKRGDNNGII